MIRHNIVRHKPRIKISNSAHLPAIHTPVTPIVHTGYTGFWLGKMQYAEMLKNLRMAVGDFCFFRSANYPINIETELYRVTEINEIHWMDDGNSFTKKAPTPYLVRNKAGVMQRANDDQLIKWTFPKDNQPDWP